MKICLAQLNTTVADFDGNAAKITKSAAAAAAQGAEIIVFPEMCLTSYPPRDLLLRHTFIEAQLTALDCVARDIKGIWAVVGFVSRNETGRGKPLRNSIAVIHGGRVADVRHKMLLPTYDVFDESRYFEPAAENPPVAIAGHRVGLTICEDAWARYHGPEAPAYFSDPVAALCKGGVEFIINASASPFTLGKQRVRRELLSHYARSCGKPLLYVNQVGGNDELVFDGDSQVYGPDGKLHVCGRLFEEDLLIFDVDNLPPPQDAPELDDVTAIHKTLVLGIRDYAHKCGFKNAVLGLSGGIDSSLVAALAAEALGPENVTGVSMPSIYSSQATIEDPAILAKNLGIRLEVIPINPAHDTFLKMLGKNLGDDNASDLARQNLQARIRGTLLMALSNRRHWLLLATGNKSELATGYCTLYGDMCGGLAPIGDVMKTQVYALSRRVNATREIIPVRVLTRSPSAELKPNQTDQDSLPPYEILDEILQAYVEDEKGVEEIVKMGFSREVVMDVRRRIATSEHKRRQAPLTLKVTSRAFGHGRRLPIARKIL